MKQEENPIPAGGNAASTSPKSESANQTVRQPAAQAKKPSGFQLVLRQIGLALLFLVIGMLAILLALYLPASSQLKKAQTELERLAPIETQYLELQTSFSNQQAQSLVYKIMSNTSQLKEALAETDANKAAQQLTYIQEDLGRLELNEFPDLPTSLTAQFEKVKTAVNGQSTSAITETEKFYNSLLNLSDNLK
jgi:hypothetical protein